MPAPLPPFSRGSCGCGRGGVSTGCSCPGAGRGSRPGGAAPGGNARRSGSSRCVPGGRRRRAGADVAAPGPRGVQVRRVLLPLVAGWAGAGRGGPMAARAACQMQPWQMQQWRRPRARGRPPQTCGPACAPACAGPGCPTRPSADASCCWVAAGWAASGVQGRGGSSGGRARGAARRLHALPPLAALARSPAARRPTLSQPLPAPRARLAAMPPARARPRRAAQLLRLLAALAAVGANGATDAASQPAPLLEVNAVAVVHGCGAPGEEGAKPGSWGGRRRRARPTAAPNRHRSAFWPAGSFPRQ